MNTEERLQKIIAAAGVTSRRKAELLIQEGRVTVNGQIVNRFEDLMSYLLNQTQPGQSVTLTILRGGKEQALKLTLGTMPTN